MITLPIPPSVNCLYAGMQRRFKSGKYKDWIETACKYNISGQVCPEKWIEVTYVFYIPLYYKNGNIKRIDVANYEKALSDFLGTVIDGFDDSRIIRMYIEKRDSSRNEVEITIKECHT